MASLRSDIAKLQEEDQSLTQQHEKRRKQFALLLHLCAELEGLTEGEMPEAVATEDKNLSITIPMLHKTVE